MISWHRVGQKVAQVPRGWWGESPQSWWRRIFPRRFSGPTQGEVVTVDGVFLIKGNVWFRFVEWPNTDVYPASCFRPVYPQIIDQLRKLDAPVPSDERLKEDA